MVCIHFIKSAYFVISLPVVIPPSQPNNQTAILVDKSFWLKKHQHLYYQHKFAVVRTRGLLVVFMSIAITGCKLFTAIVNGIVELGIGFFQHIPTVTAQKKTSQKLVFMIQYETENKLMCRFSL